MVMGHCVAERADGTLEEPCTFNTIEDRVT